MGYKLGGGGQIWGEKVEIVKVRTENNVRIKPTDKMIASAPFQTARLEAFSNFDAVVKCQILFRFGLFDHPNHF